MENFDHTESYRNIDPDHRSLESRSQDNSNEQAYYLGFAISMLMLMAGAAGYILGHFNALHQ